MAPNADETVTLFSDPIVLGRVHTDAAGSFAAVFVIPATIAAGNHTITASGVGASVAVSIVVTSAGHFGVTGTDSSDLLLLALALGFAGLVLLAGRSLGDQGGRR